MRKLPVNPHSTLPLVRAKGESFGVIAREDGKRLDWAGCVMGIAIPVEAKLVGTDGDGRRGKDFLKGIKAEYGRKGDDGNLTWSKSLLLLLRAEGKAASTGDALDRRREDKCSGRIIEGDKRGGIARGSTAKGDIRPLFSPKGLIMEGLPVALVAKNDADDGLPSGLLSEGLTPTPTPAASLELLFLFFRGPLSSWTAIRLTPRVKRWR